MRNRSSDPLCEGFAAAMNLLLAISPGTGPGLISSPGRLPRGAVIVVNLYGQSADMEPLLENLFAVKGV